MTNTAGTEGISLYYYLAPNGETRGPTSLVALQALAKARVPDINDSTLVWTEGYEGWIPFKDTGLTPKIGGGEGTGRGMKAASEQPMEGEEPIASENEDEVGGSDDDDNKADDAAGKEQQKRTKKTKKKKPANCSVYISGLPKNTTEEEVAKHFAKCGLLRRDNNKPRIKLYRNFETGELKGDAIVTYVAPESVFLAIQQFDDADFRDKCILHVKEAEYAKQDESETDKRSGLADHKKKALADPKATKAKRVRHLQERALLSWNEDSYSTKESALLIVVIKRMFIPAQLQSGGAQAINDLEKDLIQGLDYICPLGDEIKKVTVFKSHPEGVILVRFKDAVIAADCVNLMNGRYYDGPNIEATLWDGVTEYAPQDDVEARVNEQEERMKAYDEWLETQPVDK